MKDRKLSRMEFVFTIGYDGSRAVVDGQAARRYRSLAARDLAEKGLFRAAWSAAVYSGDEAEKRAVAELYNRAVPFPADDAALDRLFGVFPVAASSDGAAAPHDVAPLGAAALGNAGRKRPLVL
jgi:hypothetical protein